ncbi:MAG: DUF370 domain-containing protein [Oscillospiraceae bacterium]|jgi:hypothetical protein|nr:DUF370 domain-containing protein [Oscillospiraceae bacterium]
MYLHLGKDTLIKQADVIGIFDLDNTTVSKLTRDYLTRAEKSGRVVNVSLDLPKSFIVTLDKVYISNISSTTLLKRTAFLMHNS